jgi:hypothetical protein
VVTAEKLDSLWTTDEVAVVNLYALTQSNCVPLVCEDVRASFTSAALIIEKSSRHGALTV